MRHDLNKCFAGIDNSTREVCKCDKLCVSRGFSVLPKLVQNFHPTPRVKATIIRWYQSEKQQQHPCYRLSPWNDYEGDENSSTEKFSF